VSPGPDARTRTDRGREVELDVAVGYATHVAAPLFNGITAYAREEDQRWSPPLLAIRPHRNQFASIVVPPERLLAAAVVPHAEYTQWSIELRGEFSRTDDPPLRIAGPMADRDAEGICAALVAHYRLPRTPIDASPDDIARLSAHSYVTVIGRYRRGHAEMANFEGVLLVGADLEHGRRYRVTGFTDPGVSSASPFAPMPVGYHGPKLTAVEVTPLE